MESWVCGIDGKPVQLLFLCAVPECTGLTEKCETQAECRFSYMTASVTSSVTSVTGQFQWAAWGKYIVFPFILFFPPLHPLIFSQGHRKLQTIPACTSQAGKSLEAFRLQCRHRFIPPGNLEFPVHLTVGRIWCSCRRNKPSAQLFSEDYNINIPLSSCMQHV